MTRIAVAGLILGLAAAGLSACAAPPAPTAGQEPPPATYACDGGKGFTVTFHHNADLAEIAAGGATRTLPHAMSASGARYAEGEFEYWSKGREAMLNGFPGGPYDGCRTN